MAKKRVIGGFVDVPASIAVPGSGAIQTTPHILKGDNAGAAVSAGIDLDTDGTMASNSDAKVASQKAIVTYVAANASGAMWGSVGGTLSNQTDLQTALNLKANSSALGVLAAGNTSADVPYDHTISGLTATNVKTAIDEVVSDFSGGIPAGSTGDLQYNNGGVFGGITPGTGVVTALGNNVGSAGSPVTFNGALGTPSSGTLTNATGLPIASIVGDQSTVLKTGSIELGALTDTTLTRVSAGKIAVEGVNVVTTSSTISLSNKTLVAPALGTPASGVLTNCTGLPVASVVGDTVTALGAGTIELGAAADTTISRVSAGKIAVEGVNVVTLSSTDTLINKTLTSPILTTPALGTPTSGNLASCTFPTLNQNTTGSAATLTTTRTIGGSNFNGSANVTSFPAPGAIGGTTPAAGAFTTLSATGHTTFEGVTSTGALGTGKIIYDSTIDTDVTLAGNLDTKVASQKATKAYVDATAGSGFTESAITGQPDIVALGPGDLFVVYDSSGAALAKGTVDELLTWISAQNLTLTGTNTLGTISDLGTPGAGVLTNCTGLLVASIVGDTTTAVGVGSLNIGHASDTTVARVSAGKISVEGVNVVTTSSTDTLTNKTLTSPTLTTPVLGTPSSGTLTSCSGLPVSGITASTSTAIGVGSIELGHATDTTIARSGAGAITVEGVQVILSGAALGTPASGTLSGCSGLPVSGITASTSTALGVGSVELGHASDTTLTRASAGVLAVEGVNVLTAAQISDTAYDATTWDGDTTHAPSKNAIRDKIESLGTGGTVTHTGGALTANAVVLGAGSADTKVVAGITCDGTSVVTLGVNATTAGGVKMFGGTSGDATIQPTAVAGTSTVVTLPNASSTLPIFGQQITFTGPTAARSIALPDAAFTVARTDAANTFTGTQTITTIAGTATITGTTGNMTITAGTGNSRTLALQSTTSGGTATTFLTGDASQNTTLAGNLTLGPSTSSITGAAGNMTITSGTGNSRTMTLRTTGAGGTATTAMVLNADQSISLAGKIAPSADDGGPLGDTTHNFSDLFLATGAVLNYQNGDVAVTHSSGILTMGTGELRITTPGTNAASVPTLGSTSTLTNKTLTSPTLTTPALGTPASGVLTNCQIPVTTKSTATTYTIGTTSALEAYGGVIYVTGACTVTLPAIAAGMSCTVITYGAVAVSVDTNGSEAIILDGTLLTGGHKATNKSTTGDIIVLTYNAASTWYAASNGWTDGG